MKLEAATLRGLRSAQPLATAVAAGTLYFVTDESALERSSGTAWEDYSPAGSIGYTYTPPVDGDFAWVNQGTASVSTTDGGILLTAPAVAAADNLRLRVKSAPATPYVVTAAFQHLAGKRVNGTTYGLGFRQVSTGKTHLFMISSYVAGNVVSIKFDTPTTWSATYLQTAMSAIDRPMPPRFLRIADNGTNRILSFSEDGFEWGVFHTIGRTDYITADQVGFFVNAFDTVVAQQVRLLSWAQT